MAENNWTPPSDAVETNTEWNPPADAVLSEDVKKKESTTPTGGKVATTGLPTAGASEETSSEEEPTIVKTTLESFKAKPELFSQKRTRDIFYKSLEETQGIAPEKVAAARKAGEALFYEPTGAARTYEEAQKKLAETDKMIAQGNNWEDKKFIGENPLAVSAKQNRPALSKYAAFAQENVAKDLERINKEMDLNIKGYITKDQSGFEIPDAAKIGEFSRQKAIQNGLDKEGYFQKLVYNKMMAQVEHRIIEPTVNKTFEANFKKEFGTDYSSYMSDKLAKGYKQNAKIEADVLEQQKAIADEVKLKASEEIQPYKEEYDKYSTTINEAYKTQIANINAKQQQIQDAYKAGQIDEVQANAALEESAKEGQQLYDAYKSNFEKSQQEFLKQINTVNSKYNRQYQRQANEVLRIGNEQIQKDFLKYQKEYKADPALQAKVNEIYTKSYSQALRANQAARNALEKLDNPTALWFKGYLSTLGTSMSGLSTAAGWNYGSELGDRMSKYFRVGDSNIESLGSLLDPQTLIRSTSSLAGGMTAAMGAGIAAGAATGGAGALPAALTAGIVSWGVETADMAGNMYKDIFAETGSYEKASRAANQTLTSQAVLMPTYALEMLPFVEGALKGVKNKFLRAAVGAGIEYGSELTQEFPQNIFEANIRAGRSFFDLKTMTNDFQDYTPITKQLKETALNLIPMIGMGAMGPAFEKGEHTPEEVAQAWSNTQYLKDRFASYSPFQSQQFISSIVNNKGESFATALVDGMFANGSIDEETHKDLKTQVEKTKNMVADLGALNLSMDDSKAYGALVDKAEGMRKKAALTTDEQIKNVLLEKAKTIDEQAQSILNHQGADYVTVEYPNGEKMIWSNDEVENALRDEEFMANFMNGNMKLTIFNATGKENTISTKISQAVEQETSRVNKAKAEEAQAQRYTSPELMDKDLSRMASVAPFEGEIHMTNPIRFMEPDLASTMDAISENTPGKTAEDLKKFDTWIWQTYRNVTQNNALTPEEKKHTLEILKGAHESMWDYNDEHLTGEEKKDVQQTLTQNENDSKNISGVPSEIGVRPKPLETELVEGGGTQTPGRGGMVQEAPQENEKITLASTATAPAVNMVFKDGKWNKEVNGALVEATPEEQQSAQKQYETTQAVRPEKGPLTEQERLESAARSAAKREEVKTKLQQLRDEGVLISAETSLLGKVKSALGMKRKAVPMTDAEIDAQMTLLDSMAKVWEKTTGLDNFYDKFIADVQKADIKSFKDKGGALFQDLTNPAQPISRVTLAVFNDPAFQKMKGQMVAINSINDLIKSRGKQIEKDIINEVLAYDKYKGQKKINFDEFKNDVEMQVMTLEQLNTSTYSSYGMDNLGGNEDYGSAETVIFNAPVDHGQTAHFSNDFVPDKAKKVNWELIQIPDTNQWVAIDADRPSGLSQEQMMGYIGTAGPKEIVENWIDERKNKESEKINVGMFGHIRRWFDKASGIFYNAELQSDYFQKNKAYDAVDFLVSQEELDEVKNDIRNKTVKQRADRIVNELGFTVTVEGNNITIQDKFGLELDSDEISSDKSSEEAIEWVKNRMIIDAAATLNGVEVRIQYGDNTAKTAKILLGGNRTETMSFSTHEEALEFRKKYDDYSYEAYEVARDSGKEEFTLIKEGVDKWKQEKLKELEKSGAIPLIEKQFISSAKIHEIRLLKEAIKRAADEGATKFRFPLPFTLAVIENYVKHKKLPYDIISGDESRLNIGDTINYEGDEYVVVETYSDSITVAPVDEVNTYDLDEAINDEVDQVMSMLDSSIERQVEDIENIKPEEIEDLDFDAYENFVKRRLDVAAMNYNEAIENGEEPDPIKWSDIRDRIEEKVREVEGSRDVDDIFGWADRIYYGSDYDSVYTVLNRRKIVNLEQPDSYADGYDENNFENGVSERDMTIVNKYKELNKVLQKLRPDSKVVEDGNGMKWLETQITDQDRTNPIVAFQKDGARAKGAVDFVNDNKATVYLFNGADISTLAHEFTGHVGRRFLEQLAQSDAKFAKDYEAIKKWANVKDNEWTTAAEEKFARGFEKYLRDGIAPTKALENVFSKLSEWMLNIYQTIKGGPIDIQITNQVRNVFDAMLGGRIEKAAETKLESAPEIKAESVPEVKENIIFTPIGYYEALDKNGYPSIAFTDQETGHTEFETSKKPQISASKNIGGAITGLFSMLRNNNLDKKQKIVIYEISETPSIEIPSDARVADFPFINEVRYDKKVNGKKIKELTLSKEQIDFLNDFYNSFEMDSEEYSDLLKKYNANDLYELENIFKRKISDIGKSEEGKYYRAVITNTYTPQITSKSQKIAPEIKEAKAETVDKFTELTNFDKKIAEAKGSMKQKLIKRRDTFVAQNQSVAEIVNNADEIIKQLKEEKVIEETKGPCFS